MTYAYTPIQLNHRSAIWIRLGCFRLKTVYICVRVWFFFSRFLSAPCLIFAKYFSLWFISWCFVCFFVWRIGQQASLYIIRVDIFTFCEGYIKSLSLSTNTLTHKNACCQQQNKSNKNKEKKKKKHQQHKKNMRRRKHKKNNRMNFLWYLLFFSFCFSALC